MDKKERPQNKNLIPAKPGEIRNPQGMKPGTITKHTIIKNLERLLSSKIKYNSPLTGRSSKKEIAALLVEQLLADAMSKGNNASDRSQANKVIQERVLGKPVQPIGVTPDTEVTIVISNSENRL